MATISIIVPVYNVEKYLPRCIDSILAQTFRDFECILVDDGSPDNCGAICDAYAEKDSRIRVIHQQNGGLSAARNAGIDWAFANSDSKWIGFVDSDDWIHPQYLEALYREATEHSTEISMCRLARVATEPEEQTEGWSSMVVSAQDAYTNFGKGTLCYFPGRLYRKTLFQSVRFPVGKAFEDVFTQYKVILQTDRVAYIEQELYYYFINENGIVRAAWSPRYMDVIEAHEEQLRFLAEHKEYAQTYRVIQHYYLNELANSYYKLRTSDRSETEKKHYSSVIGKKIRQAFRKYGHVVRFSENKTLYEAAYPKRMELYWMLCGAIRKLHK